MGFFLGEGRGGAGVRYLGRQWRDMVDVDGYIGLLVVMI